MSITAQAAKRVRPTAAGNQGGRTLQAVQTPQRPAEQRLCAGRCTRKSMTPRQDGVLFEHAPYSSQAFCQAAVHVAARPGSPTEQPVAARCTECTRTPDNATAATGRPAALHLSNSTCASQAVLQPLSGRVRAASQGTGPGATSQVQSPARDACRQGRRCHGANPVSRSSRTQSALQPLAHACCWTCAGRCPSLRS